MTGTTTVATRWPPVTGGLLSQRVFPALAGTVAALLLGVAGFGLGCVYGMLAAPLSQSLLPAAVAAPAARTSAGTPVASHIRPSADPLPVVNVPAQDAGLPSPARGISRFAMLSPVDGGWISSAYGPRADPFTGLPAIHRGVDFGSSGNAAIKSVAAGVVTWSGRQSGYGNLIEIDHGNGWVTRYGHNSRNLVRPGDRVGAGQTIALMGATGRATGTHLHFEVLYHGRAQNPARYVPRSA